MFGWFFPSSSPTKQDALAVLDRFRYSSDVEFMVKTLKNAMDTWKNIHVSFLSQLAKGESYESTVELMKGMMTEWPEDLAQTMSDLLKSENVCAAKAMGSEKSKFNKQYYTLVRNAMKMSSEDFRKFLVAIRKGMEDAPLVVEGTKPYCLCLFNEPLVFNITNLKCNEDVPIITLYKGVIKRHPYMYDPVETQLDAPLTQNDVYTLQKEAKTNVPLVILAANIDENVVLPENVWVVFTESTKSWGSRIVPFFNENTNSVLLNMINLLEN